MKPWEIALLEYDTAEIIGLQNNPKILEYAKEIGATWVSNDETPWCAIFMQWCLMKADKPFSYLANARSFLNYGLQTDRPELGDIAVLWRDSPTAKTGHVAFFIKENDNTVWLLGGNQNNKVTILPFNKKQVLSYRKILDN
jgi:uncharacterized protein (TIGR02594 family)